MRTDRRAAISAGASARKHGGPHHSCGRPCDLTPAPRPIKGKYPLSLTFRNSLQAYSHLSVTKLVGLHRDFAVLEVFPTILTKYLRPWCGAVQAVTHGKLSELRVTTSSCCICLIDNLQGYLDLRSCMPAPEGRQIHHIVEPWKALSLLTAI